MKLKAEIEVTLSKEDIDDILFSAFNAGGISGWANKIQVVGEKLGKSVYEQVGLGGSVVIHDFFCNCSHELNLKRLQAGATQYLNESCRVRIVNGRIPRGEIDANEADCIVQLSLFGKIKYPL